MKTETLKTIWLTAIHLLLVVSVAGNYLYISDKYALVKIDALQAHEAAQDSSYQREQEQYALAIAESGKETKSVFAAYDNQKKRGK